MAFHLAQKAEEKGLLKPHSGDVIYEGTVGSTGISLATVCRAKGYLAHMYIHLCFNVHIQPHPTPSNSELQNESNEDPD